MIPNAAGALFTPTPGDFKEARRLDLTARPNSHQAKALIGALVMLLEARMARRTNKRGPAGRAKLHHAVAGIVGGIMLNQFRDPPYCSKQSNKREAFSGGPIGFRQWQQVTDALRVSPALIGWQDGITHANFGVFTGKPSCCWALPALMSLAAEHGVTGGRDEWTHCYSTALRPVRDVLSLRYLTEKPGRAGECAAPDTLGFTSKGPEIATDDARANALREHTSAYNVAASQHSFTGCNSPQWFRSFLVPYGQMRGWNLGGRWWAIGAGNYQGLSSEARRCILIDGRPVVEVDVSASHLSIFLAQMGVHLDGDPYDIPGIPRDSVKAWVVQTFGAGKPAAQWGKGTPSGVLAGPPLAAVRSASLHRYPCLEKPWLLQGVIALGGNRRGIVANYLMGLEAMALTAAMESLLSGTGEVALPMHDGLLVPAHIGEAAQAALRVAYREVAGVSHIRLTVTA